MNKFKLDDIVCANRSEALAQVVEINQNYYKLRYLDKFSGEYYYEIPLVEEHWHLSKSSIATKPVCTCGAKYTSNPNYHLKFACDIKN